MEWMAWTQPTALFFVTVALSLVLMTLWEIRSPTEPRKGLLPLVTTRGDRFFIALLASAFVHAAWLALSDTTVVVASGISILLGIALLRWG